MRRLVPVVTGALIAAGLATPAHAAPSQAEIALRWAPIHYQDVDATGSHAVSGKSDYITRYDFDGNLNGRDNWDNTGTNTDAAVYYSVLETSTHYYLTYLFFHPRDWIDHPFFETEHENDGEGVLEIVAKDDSDYGSLKAAVTVAHTDFYSYKPTGSDWANGSETIDGTLQLQSSPHDSFQHPVTAQERGGHGLKAYPQYNINGDGIVYYPSLSVSESPSSTNDRDVRYRLIDIFADGGLWAQRNTTSLFASLGTFAGDTSGGCGTGTYACGTNSANAPWGWDDGNDAVARGEIATDPAKLAASYFSATGTLSRTYTHNPYSVAAAALRAAQNQPPTID
ncbi:hypothetical protein GCM10010112_40240 [Actinoplanes lobatus]|uniref:Uncharacterized protein n=1 Tax=Actinoplanes lobatus TaxID=113568 RepID=A0A7W7MKN4_9ACTN|nr:hypothetical protein [Actinoplanes lobatus]MBB4753859.1 hypothetical protein [Actinoplanes lobatus]GGN72202.1 hypothetical protein GCM10010112_40240 [Actinoplanes lobatus]GIE41987.1 hypothetical protein Alo02nite_48850 [Actinoplanes lobatus]